MRRAVVRRAERHDRARAPPAAEPLHVVGGDEPALRVADDGERAHARVPRVDALDLRAHEVGDVVDAARVEGAAEAAEVERERRRSRRAGAARSRMSKVRREAKKPWRRSTGRGQREKSVRFSIRSRVPGSSRAAAISSIRRAARRMTRRTFMRSASRRVV